MDEMSNKKVQIYSNFKRQNRFMGIIDYKSLCILIIYMLILGFCINIFNISIMTKICMYITFLIPFLALIMINADQISAIDIIINIFKFILSPKIYVKNLKYYKSKISGIYVRK